MKGNRVERDLAAEAPLIPRQAWGGGIVETAEAKGGQVEEGEEQEELHEEEKDKEDESVQKFMGKNEPADFQESISLAKKLLNNKIHPDKPVDESPLPHTNREKPTTAPFKLYRRKSKRVKRVIDLFTYSPYFRTCSQFGTFRAFCASYAWVSLFVSIGLWGKSGQLTRGNYPCKASEHVVGIFFTHPTFWNLFLSAIKLSLGAFLCLRSRDPKYRVWYSLLEHVALPGVVTYSIFFWGAYKELDSVASRGIAFNNHLAFPLVLLAEAWVSKTPFLIERIWEIILYVIWLALFVFAFDAVADGCFLVPALNPDRNVTWISYPGFLMLYLAGFFMCYTFTQFRDHVAPCGQEIFAPQVQAPIRIHFDNPCTKKKRGEHLQGCKHLLTRVFSFLKSSPSKLAKLGKPFHNRLHPEPSGNRKTSRAWEGEGPISG